METGGGSSELLPSFYRDAEQRAVGLTERLEGTYRARFRTLQTETGDAVARGRTVFMDKTFGNEDFFGGVLGLHTLLRQVTPAQAVALGIQVDVTRVRQEIVDVLMGDDLPAKDAALDNPDITVALVQDGAVIGVRGFFDAGNPSRMTSAGITCALCHVNVEPTTFELSAGSTALPIGVPRIDGVPNTSLNAGAILAATPGLGSSFPDLVPVLNGWGPGRFDVRALDVPDVDRNPLEDHVVNPTAYPPIWNFVDLQEQDYRIGWDGLFQGELALASISEAVYDLIFHGNGAFGIPEFVVNGGTGGTIPPALAITPPQELVNGLVESETERPGNDIVPPEDLLDIQAFMGSLASPAPVEFDPALAEQGFDLFHGEAACSSCHSSADFTGPGLFVITDPAPQGDLAPGIKVPGLRGVAHTAPFFHDGSAATLADVVARYVARGAPVGALSAEQQAAVVEYLKSH